MITERFGLVVYRCGSLPYEYVWRLQERLAGWVAAGQHPPVLLLLEHPHTYTFGRRASRENLVWDEELLSRQGVTVHWVDRGGDVTYHGPGQLVGYPILPLGIPARTAAGENPKLPQADFVGYIRRLERMLVRSLARLGVPAGQREGLTGVWVQPDAASGCIGCDPADSQPPAKIASIGVKVDARGVTRHGFALNVNPDPHYWEGIIPCGLKDVRMAALVDFLQPVPEMETVMDCVVETFGDEFACAPLEKSLNLELFD